MELNKEINVFKIWRKTLSLSYEIRATLLKYIFFICLNKFSALSIAYFVSQAITKENSDPIKYSVLFLMFKLLEWIFFIFQDHYLVKSRTVVISHISGITIDKLMNLDNSELKNESTIDLLRKADIRNIFRNLIGFSINHFLSLFIDLVLTALIIYSIGGNQVGYVFTILLITFLCLFLFGIYTAIKAKDYSDIIKNENNLISSTKDLFSKFFLAKAYNAEDLFVNIRQDLSDKEVKVLTEYRVDSVKYHAVMFFMASASFALLFFLSINKINNSMVDKSVFASMMVVLIGLYWKLQQITYIFEEMRIYPKLISFAFNVMETESEKLNQEKIVCSSIQENKLEIKNVNFSYGQKEVLKNINLTLNKGETLFLVGESGAGKSTLFNLLLADIYPSSGEILFNGLNINQYKNLVSWVPQDTLFNGGTLDFNLSIGNHLATKEEKIEALKKAHIFDRLNMSPNILEQIIDKKSFSGGELQRISIARAYLSKRPIMLLDEPSSALDLQLEKKFFDELLLLKEDIKLIIIHRILSIPENSKIAVLKNGSIIEMGTLEELIAQKGYFYELYQEAINE